MPLFADEGRLNAEFTKTLLELNDDDWKQLGSSRVPFERHSKVLLGMLNKLQRVVPPSFLKNNVAAVFPAPLPAEEPLKLAALTGEADSFRGNCFEIRGNVIAVQELPTAKPPCYRCKIQVVEKERVKNGADNDVSSVAEVLVPFVPAGWTQNKALKERAAFRGIYVKILSDSVPLFVSPRLKWYPNTFLGNLGFDAASLEQIPALKISDFNNTDLKLPPFFQGWERREVLRRAFRFTDYDSDPFYGLLKCLSTLPSGRLEREARDTNRTNGITVADLFNKPAETRGKPLLLHGTAKRVIPTAVEDEEVKRLYGIDRYYQIYLFTKESQGHPLVVCVHSLPEGMPTGSEANFSEEISVAVIPYKLWIYESSTSVEEPNNKKPNYAPLLIGRSPIYVPKSKTADKMPSVTFYTLFAVMLVVWFALRTYRARKIKQTIEWRK